jgi:hypothetical protein
MRPRFRSLKMDRMDSVKAMVGTHRKVRACMCTRAQDYSYK